MNTVKSWLTVLVLIAGIVLGACIERTIPPISTSPPGSQPQVATASSPTPLPAPVASVDLRPRNIILIGWDGAQRNHIKECLDRNELPNLKRLTSAGALVAIDITRVTDTKAGWAQILTGYEPETTGVFSNSRYQPIPKGYTVFERLENFFGKDDIVTVAVIGKKGNVDADPPGWERVP
ncbi:MAG: alkaline phosphatase family protein, partial [Dehalococcoidia bacterium]|nr:alkaline phosphatase family protein [Dehalococcoidia bacterium]